MPRSVRISPSILAADFGRLAEDVAAVAAAGADLIHYDVMDGRFVPNITVGPDILAALKKATEVPLDVHLMIVEPERHLEAFIKAGAAILTVHAEVCPHLHRTLQHIRSLGCQAGVSLNPSTPLSVVEHVLEELDLLLIMTVNPGFGGQSFIDAMLPKIRAARALLDGVDRPISLEVDGGVVVDNIASVCAAGADTVVSGTGVFRTDDYAATISQMRKNVAALDD